MMKRIAMLCLALCLLFFTACGEDEEIVDEYMPDSPEVELQEGGQGDEENEPEEDELFGYINPLTGMSTNVDFTGQRPFAVVVNNLREAMPQVGVSQADIIYEIAVEGGVTRMVALFQDLYGIGEIGPVRSARSYHIDIAESHDALFIHAGGSEQAYSLIWGRGISNIDGVMGAGLEFYRDPERTFAGLEHSMMTTSELILGNLDSYNFRREHDFMFSHGLTFVPDGTPEDGMRVDTINVWHSWFKNTLFEFNPRTGLYLISQHDEPYMDAAIDEQVAVTNVLVLFTNVAVLDYEGRLAVDLTTAGHGYFINGGYMVPILWSREDGESPFVYTLENGHPLELGVGRSFINIIAVGNEVEFE